MPFVKKWTVDQDAMLTELWMTKLTCTEIAHKMGLSTKSMVIGRAHRLKLLKRQNPVKRTKVKINVKPLVQEEKPLVKKVSVIKEKKRVRNKTVPKMAEKPIISAPVIQQEEVKVFVKEIRGCRYPMWNNKERPTNVYCDKPISVKSYCTHHAGVCFTKSFYEVKKEAA